MPPWDFYAVVHPGARLYYVDLDRRCDPIVITALIEGTGQSRRKLGSLTLREYQGRVYEDDKPKAALTWLPHANGGNNSFGQQACPKCLASGAPYYRKSWRLSFLTGCHKHGIGLIDRCPNCGASISPLRSLGEATFCLCHQCRTDLRDAPALPVNSEDMQKQQNWNDIAGRGSAPLGEFGYVHSLVYFRILRKLFRLIVTGEFALPLREHVLLGTGWEIAPMAIPRLKYIDRLPPEPRRIALRFADHLMADWPRRFINACKAVGLSRRRLIRAEETQPYAFLSPIEEHLDATPTYIDADQFNHAVTYLKLTQKKPTYAELTALLNNRIHSKRLCAAPVRQCRPYGTHRYWKLDGVSPSTREAAKRAARRAGENVGSWVDRIIRKALENNS